MTVIFSNLSRISKKKPKKDSSSMFVLPLFLLLTVIQCTVSTMICEFYLISTALTVDLPINSDAWTICKVPTLLRSSLNPLWPSYGPAHWRTQLTKHTHHIILIIFTDLQRTNFFLKQCLRWIDSQSTGPQMSAVTSWKSTVCCSFHEAWLEHEHRLEYLT